MRVLRSVDGSPLLALGEKVQDTVISISTNYGMIDLILQSSKISVFP